MNDMVEVARASIWGYALSFINLFIAPWVPYEVTLVIAAGAIALFVQGYRAERRRGRWMSCDLCGFRVRSDPPSAAQEVYRQHLATSHRHTR